MIVVLQIGFPFSLYPQSSSFLIYTKQLDIECRAAFFDDKMPSLEVIFFVTVSNNYVK